MCLFEKSLKSCSFHPTGVNGKLTYYEMVYLSDQFSYDGDMV